MRTRRGERGLGLVELLVAFAITGAILSVLGLTLVSILKNSSTAADQQSSTHQLRDGLFWLNQDTQSGVASQASVAPGDVTMQWTDYSTGDTYTSRVVQVASDLQRTITVNGVPTTRIIARNLPAGGFTAAQAGNVMTYTLTVQNGATTQTQTETTAMRVDDAPLTPFPTVTYTLTPTPSSTATSTATNTPTATSTSTPLSCTTSDTGDLSPAAAAADTGGAGDGFELLPANAYADGGGNAGNLNGNGDRHRYYDYGVNLPGGCTVTGVAVRLDYWLKNTGGTNTLSVDLSWDGGTTWTSVKSDSSEPGVETTVILGGPGDTWGRAWTASEFTNANFRVRVAMDLGNGGQEVYLDWIPLRVYYAPAPTHATPTHHADEHVDADAYKHSDEHAHADAHADADEHAYGYADCDADVDVVVPDWHVHRQWVGGPHHQWARLSAGYRDHPFEYE